jgi:hypothetical protein
MANEAEFVSLLGEEVKGAEGDRTLRSEVSLPVDVQ